MKTIKTLTVLFLLMLCSSSTLVGGCFTCLWIHDRPHCAFDGVSDSMCQVRVVGHNVYCIERASLCKVTW